jgi:hypothetical protein
MTNAVLWLDQPAFLLSHQMTEEKFKIKILNTSLSRSISIVDGLAIFSAKLVVCNRGLTSYIDTTAKCRHLIKFTCKGTLRQEFIRVYRLEIQSVMLVFSTQLCELLPSPLLAGSNPPPPSLCE